MSRNVVLVTVDSLRADHCGFMGYGRNTTPTLDRFAENGVVWENAIAPSSGTAFSMPAAFTGVESLTEADQFDSGGEYVRWNMERFRTVTEWFSERGYSTLGFSPNPYTSRHFGFDKGFDFFQDFLRPEGSFNLRRRILSRWVEGGFVAGFRLFFNMLGMGDVSVSWQEYYEDILERVEAVKEPFFLWIFLLEPHWPYQPPRRHRDVPLIETYRQNWIRAVGSSPPMSDANDDILRSLYDGAIRHVDEFIGRITTDLAEYDPAFVFHADHGEAFGEHGNYGHSPHVYEENIHVPLLVWGIDRTARIDRPVSLLELPRILRSVAMDTALQGDNPTAAVTSRAVDAASGLRIPAECVRWTSLKGIRGDGGPAVYRLDSDPDESAPIDVDMGVSPLGTAFSAADVRPRERRLIADATASIVENDASPLG